MSRHSADEVADAQDGWKADPLTESDFVTKSDEWFVFFLGSNLQIGTLRFAYAAAFAAIGATLLER